MSPPRPRLSFLLLTEDTGKDAFAVLSALLKKMLYLIDAQCDLDRARVEPATDRAKAAMDFNGWKGTGKRGKDHHKRTDLAQAIATALLRQDQESFVFIHVDGDCPWSASKQGAQGENIKCFRRLILPAVRSLLSDQAGALEGRILLIIPYYSIESWLYQNVDEALRIYRKHLSTAHEDIRQFEAWQRDPAALDEVNNPKDHVRIHSQYNLRLATEQFPARKLFALGLSFTHTVRSLEQCADLLRALSAIRHV